MTGGEQYKTEPNLAKMFQRTFLSYVLVVLVSRNRHFDHLFVRSQSQRLENIINDFEGSLFVGFSGVGWLSLQPSMKIL